MNELIKELIDQSYTEVMHERGGRYMAFDKEKFAELIVRECRYIVEQDMKLAHIQMIPLTLEMYANGRLQRTIKEHFGLAEREE